MTMSPNYDPTVAARYAPVGIVEAGRPLTIIEEAELREAMSRLPDWSGPIPDRVFGVERYRK